jgi:hypothetical protein
MGYLVIRITDGDIFRKLLVAKRKSNVAIVRGESVLLCPVGK